MPAWNVNGQYYETCSCDFVCPCLPGQLTVTPTKGSCTFAMAFQIERGKFGDVGLDGLGFIVLGYTPEAMIKGNWSIGLLMDERATEPQRDAITAIASGSAGGPMAAVGGLVGKFLGAESAPIVFDRNGVKWSVKASGFVEMAAEGAKGMNPDDRAYVSGQHRASGGRPVRARASMTIHALELDLEDTSSGTTDSTRRSPGAVRDQALIAACAIAVTGLAWAYLFHLDREMSLEMAWCSGRCPGRPRRRTRRRYRWTCRSPRRRSGSRSRCGP
jgi:hypothetical protein